ncbi:WxL protein peptidoglycan domain-containing protein [Microbacterium enclense]|uniref:DUF916 domain-containing protein n=1 Tax=Microbacterium enclense TaxID=993073 RepID=A0A1G6GM93_9MICO|nr:DUF916 domain-containing protein [Microbacterium enclense]KSU56359.1 hypothetical protein AS029_00970 [Microbacterium enclense]SDB83142.1 protein of unknown function [Microbacterium enclense]
MNLLRSLAAFAVATAFLVPAGAVQAVGAAATTDTADASTTWSVRPGDADGPDGRAWVELDLDPGTQETESLTVTNHGTQDVTFRLSAADGYFTANGRFNILPSDRESTDAGLWIDIAESVDVAGGQTAVVPFTVSVPEDATPGDHLAGVAASVVSRGDSQVGLESRVGFRVLTRVTGELSVALSAGVTSTFDSSWNPFQSGGLRIDYRIENVGNTRLGATPTFRIAGPFGLFARDVEGAVLDETAPGETRASSLDVPGLWPLGWYSVDMTLAPAAVVDGTPLENATVSDARSTSVAIPWSQLLLAAFVAGLIWWYLADRRRLVRAALRPSTFEDAVSTVASDGRPRV